MHEINCKTMRNIFASASAYLGMPLINELLSKLLDKEYYETNRQFIQDIEQRQVSTRAQHFEELVDPSK